MERTRAEMHLGDQLKDAERRYEESKQHYISEWEVMQKRALDAEGEVRMLKAKLRKCAVRVDRESDFCATSDPSAYRYTARCSLCGGESDEVDDEDEIDFGRVKHKPGCMMGKDGE